MAARTTSRIERLVSDTVYVALDVEATAINEEMKLAAAAAIAELVAPDELNEEYIVPSMFDPRVAEAVARATREAAWASGVARKERPHTDD